MTTRCFSLCCLPWNHGSAYPGILDSPHAHPLKSAVHPIGSLTLTLGTCTASNNNRISRFLLITSRSLNSAVSPLCSYPLKVPVKYGAPQSTAWPDSCGRHPIAVVADLSRSVVLCRLCTLLHGLAWCVLFYSQEYACARTHEPIMFTQVPSLGFPPDDTPFATGPQPAGFRRMTCTLPQPAMTTVHVWSFAEPWGMYPYWPWMRRQVHRMALNNGPPSFCSVHTWCRAIPCVIRESIASDILIGPQAPKPCCPSSCLRASSTPARFAPPLSL
jgi:hypothetical protein